jgi:multiple antibiotic resistance protein
LLAQATASRNPKTFRAELALSHLIASAGFFITLLALADPLRNLPQLARFVEREDARHRSRCAVFLAIALSSALAFCYLAGPGIFRFFSISTSQFRIVAGLLFFYRGLDMLQSRSFPAVSSRRRFCSLIPPFALLLLMGTGGAIVAAALVVIIVVWARARRSASPRPIELVVPFIFPFLIGPETISAAILFGADAGSGDARLEGLATICALSVGFAVAAASHGPLPSPGIAIRALGLLACAAAIYSIALSGRLPSITAALESSPQALERTSAKRVCSYCCGLGCVCILLS